MNEQELEQEIQDKELTAPRLTPDLINKTIRDKTFHVFGDTCLTVCCLTLQNGFTVTGESACASPENFNQEIGEKIAFENARDKIWALEGYLLKQKLFETKDSNWVARMLSEQHEIKTRVDKLTAMVSSDTFKTLPPEDQELLHTQLGHMCGYLETLSTRIARTNYNF